MKVKRPLTHDELTYGLTAGKPWDANDWLNAWSKVARLSEKLPEESKAYERFKDYLNSLDALYAMNNWQDFLVLMDRLESGIQQYQAKKRGIR